MDLDVVVIGAGVVGLAVAGAVARPGRSVFVVDRAGSPGTGTTSRNSEVLHSGIYYPTGSKKAIHCVAGNRRWREVGHIVELAPIGKLIIARGEAEIADLERLRATGEANGVPDLCLLDHDSVKRIEPHVRAVAGLLVPTAGVLSAHACVNYLAGLARGRGADLVFGAPVTAAEAVSGGYRLVVGDDSVTCRVVVNCAGLEADRIAALVGTGEPQEWVKGNYAAIGNGKAGLVQRLIYPVPEHTGVASGDKSAFSGLGVHSTKTVDGRMRLGPDVEYLNDRIEDYAVRPGTADAFHAMASRYLPFLEPEDVSPDTTGIRPKLARARDGFADFVIQEDLPGWVNLLGIESPGLTSALPIADEVATLVDANL